MANKRIKNKQAKAARNLGTRKSPEQKAQENAEYDRKQRRAEQLRLNSQRYRLNKVVEHAEELDSLTKQNIINQNRFLKTKEALSEQLQKVRAYEKLMLGQLSSASRGQLEIGEFEQFQSLFDEPETEQNASTSQSPQYSDEYGDLSQYNDHWKTRYDFTINGSPDHSLVAAMQYSINLGKSYRYAMVMVRGEGFGQAGINDYVPQEIQDYWLGISKSQNKKRAKKRAEKTNETIEQNLRALDKMQQARNQGKVSF